MHACVDRFQRLFHHVHAAGRLNALQAVIEKGGLDLDLAGTRAQGFGSNVQAKLAVHVVPVVWAFAGGQRVSDRVIVEQLMKARHYAAHFQLALHFQGAKLASVASHGFPAVVIGGVHRAQLVVPALVGAQHFRQVLSVHRNDDAALCTLDSGFSQPDTRAGGEALDAIKSLGVDVADQQVRAVELPAAHGYGVFFERGV